MVPTTFSPPFLPYLIYIWNSNDSFLMMSFKVPYTVVWILPKISYINPGFAINLFNKKCCKSQISLVKSIYVVASPLVSAFILILSKNCFATSNHCVRSLLYFYGLLPKIAKYTGQERKWRWHFSEEVATMITLPTLWLNAFDVVACCHIKCWRVSETFFIHETTSLRGKSIVRLAGRMQLTRNIAFDCLLSF